MAISEAVRQEVMERDHGECQFMHRQPVPATEISHFDHQGLGGLPEDHWKNQAPNLAASCGECHRKLHGPGYKWLEFIAISGSAIESMVTKIGDTPYHARMIIDHPNGRVPREDLWFYVRHEATHLQLVEARIQGLAMIEGDKARDLWELSKGFKLLEPDAQSFPQYIAGRNVSANRAVEAARAYGWMNEYDLIWPVGLTSEKADIIRAAMEPTLDLTDFAIAEDAQVYLDAAVDQSVSDLKQELIDAGLMKGTVGWYIHIRAEAVNGENPVISGQLIFVRARKVEDVLAIKKPGDMVARVGKFVAGLRWDRKEKKLYERTTGFEVPYRDLT